jgi:hypothetical protein
LVGKPETIPPTDDPNLAKCTKNGVIGNYGVPVDEVADNPTFEELRVL